MGLHIPPLPPGLQAQVPPGQSFVQRHVQAEVLLAFILFLPLVLGAYVSLHHDFEMTAMEPPGLYI